jgi:hypothetical protein
MGGADIGPESNKIVTLKIWYEQWSHSKMREVILVNSVGAWGFLWGAKSNSLLDMVCQRPNAFAYGSQHKCMI